MRRKSMTQHMRRQLPGIETCLQRQRFQHLMAAAPREMALSSARWKKIPFAAADCRRDERVAHLEVIANGLARGGIERHHPFLSALALDKQKGIAIAHRGKWQCHQL